MKVVNTETVENLIALTHQGPSGASALLATMTPFEWDTVYFFRPTAAKADVERIVGHSLEIPKYSRFGLLIFTNNGDLVVLEKVLPPMNLIGEDGQRYSNADAMIEVATGDPGPYSTSRIKSAGGINT